VRRRQTGVNHTAVYEADGPTISAVGTDADFVPLSRSTPMTALRIAETFRPVAPPELARMVNDIYAQGPISNLETTHPMTRERESVKEPSSNTTAHHRRTSVAGKARSVCWSRESKKGRWSNSKTAAGKGAEPRRHLRPGTILDGTPIQPLTHRPQRHLCGLQPRHHRLIKQFPSYVDGKKTTVEAVFKDPRSPHPPHRQIVAN